MSRYTALVRVLDGICQESRSTKYENKYIPDESDIEKLWAARSRAYIHLYIKVMYGIRSFTDREAFVTDGGGDGGIDGYYIDQEKREVVVIQSKFRHNENNFESKPIELEELLAMQVRSVVSGEARGGSGEEFNGKIKGFQRRLDEQADIGRYSYKVVILANIKVISQDNLQKLTDGFDAEIINYQESYRLLLMPVLSGKLYRATDISVSLDLSNKSSGSKIGYYIETEFFDCEITVVFVPVAEVGSLMLHYRNSLLEHNPRSYLEFDGEKVNSAIKSSVVRSNINDFAMLNNGITVVCDGSSVNENSGKRNRARIFIENPQIINGGQTAYTLSRLVEEAGEEAGELFQGKEVLVKVISIQPREDMADNPDEKRDLIERISLATNSQTVVTNADRVSNDPVLREVQSALFNEFGMLLEVKRGEFQEAIREKYISVSEVITRTEFFRICLAANGRLSQGLRRKQTLDNFGSVDPLSSEVLRRFQIGKRAFDRLGGLSRRHRSHRSYIWILPKVAATLAVSDVSNSSSEDAAIRLTRQIWDGFLAFASDQKARFVRSTIDPTTGTVSILFTEGRAHYDKFDEIFNAYLASISPELGGAIINEW